ncbi:2-oxo-4-hydroxy-4-carboxy-5-ureidoimidazoline decarboxylase [Enterovibrio sp. Hal110]
MARFTRCVPNQMSESAFLDMFGGIYEHSPWVAQRAFNKGLTEYHNDHNGLHDCMAAILNHATVEEKRQVILAHPDLAGRAAVAGELTPESTSEQASAGINQCNDEEFARFTRLNERYKAKFQFPFIMAVKGANRHLILAAFEERIENDLDTEFNTAIKEINKIALFRLQDL